MRSSLRKLQLHRRAGRGTSESWNADRRTDDRQPRAALSKTQGLSQGMLLNSNLVGGFQPILQNKVVGPYIKGPLFIDEAASMSHRTNNLRGKARRQRQKSSFASNLALAKFGSQ